jgi:hypothetical protein
VPETLRHAFGVGQAVGGEAVADLRRLLEAGVARPELDEEGDRRPALVGEAVQAAGRRRRALARDDGFALAVVL